MPIGETVPVEEARSSGRLLERVIHGITYSYISNLDEPWLSGSWISGHDYASMGEVFDRTQPSNFLKRPSSRSWLIAQMIWWGIWLPKKAELEIASGVTDASMALLLFKRVSHGGLLEIYPRGVWDSMKKEWEEKFGPDAAVRTKKEEGQAGATEGGTNRAGASGTSKHPRKEESDKENEPASRRVKLSGPAVPPPRRALRDSYGNYRRGSSSLYASATPAQIAEANAQMLQTELDLNAHLRAQLDAEFHDHYLDLIWGENGSLINQLDRLRRKKRGGPGATRWYGLKGGSNPGVYTDYEELRRKQKEGKGSCQRFPSKEEAEVFVEEGRRNPSLRDQREGRAGAVNGLVMPQ